jgi:hypothetical protein
MPSRVTADDEDADSVPPEVLQAFGSEKAEPRVVKTYTPRWGLRKFKPPALFTRATARRLRERGVLEVELRWRRLRRYVSLAPGYRFIWGGEPHRRATAHVAPQPPPQDAAPDEPLDGTN